MGREYYGDINGKFWYGVQSSTSSVRFGGHYERDEDEDSEYTTSVSFYFEDICRVVSELMDIKKKHVGFKYFKMLEKHFSKNNSYDINKLAKKLSLPVDKVEYLLSEYADYQLGKQIFDYMFENGSCSFVATL
jgi:hypothetical protein